MGLLDWLTRDSSLFTGGTPIQPGPGGLMGDMDPMGNPTGQMMPLPTAAPAPTGPMPDVNGPGMDAPMSTEGGPAPPALGQMPQLPMGGDPMADMPQGSGSVAPPGIPMPMPRPAGAPGPMMPPTDVGAQSMPPMAPQPAGPGTAEAVQSYQKAGGTFADPAQKAQAQTILGRALGLDGNFEKQLRGSLGAGLEAAGKSSGKSPFQAFSSGAGAGMKGGSKADAETTDQQSKYLQQAIAAKRAGDTAAYNVNYLKYLKENAANRLKLEQEKMASGKGSVVNSQEQLYLRAIGATNQDAGIKASANTVREAQKQFGVDSKEAKSALEAHEKRIREVRDSHLGQLGVDPKSIGSIENKAGFSDKNPVKDFPKDPAAAQKAFDALPEGAYFINPKDGKLLIKRSAGSTSAANPAQVPAAPGAPQAPLPPALATANAGDDDGV